MLWTLITTTDQTQEQKNVETVTQPEKDNDVQIFPLNLKSKWDV